MEIKKQFAKIKENWLLVLLIVILFVFLSGGMNQFESISSPIYRDQGMMMESVMMESAPMSKSLVGTADFAPEVEERKVIKTSRLTTEVERGTFKTQESKLKDIITSSDSYLLNENVNKYGTKKKSYLQGSYEIKVDTAKQASIISQLKELGEVKSFNENARDVTGSYTKTEIELETERSRLTRYEQMYKDAIEISDKIELNDRIFNQERRIKYLQDSLANIDTRIEYSTVYFSMNEKRSDYANIALIKLSRLIDSLVDSFNSLIEWIFVLLPWAIAAAIIWFIVKIIRRKK